MSIKLECYTRDEIVRLLRKRQGKRTQRELAADLGIHETYMGQIFHGKDRDITDRVLEPLGFERKVVYVLRKRARHEPPSENSQARKGVKKNGA